jgi:hypothetical protein
MGSDSIIGMMDVALLENSEEASNMVRGNGSD